ncbi:hypothetical protein ONZ51_g3623 [Trametes cubensis]|uniref:Uncharacterized protein n=1 Tax=Trametes cubensis TaxID=1111947 RepID=A0AAD7TXY1_9APHY|nr:hypothetical protein ONZ51_g3623 [Trametes cubensis]
MNDQVHRLLREHHRRRWSPRIEAGDDTAPKGLCAPSGRGTPANLLVEREKFPTRGPYVPHDYVRGLRIPKWFLTYDISTPADVLLLHRLVARREMPQAGTVGWRSYKKTSLDVVKELNKHR